MFDPVMLHSVLLLFAVWSLIYCISDPVFDWMLYHVVLLLA